MKRRTFLTRLTGATTAGTVATTGSARGQQATHTVEMYTEGGSYYFDPIGLYVKPGDTVRWVNKTGGHSARPIRRTTLVTTVLGSFPKEQPRGTAAY